MNINRRYFMATSAGLLTCQLVGLPFGESFALGEEYSNAARRYERFTLKSDGAEHVVTVDWIKMLIPTGSHFSRGMAECRVKIDDEPWQKLVGTVTSDHSCEFPFLGGLVADFGAPSC